MKSTLHFSWRTGAVVGVLVGLLAQRPAAAALYQPQMVHDADLLTNGNLLVTDGGPLGDPARGGVYEIDRSGNVVWSYTTGLNWAHNADRQTDGSVIISDTGNDRVLVVASDGAELWNTDDVTLSDGSVLNYPNDANLLANGHRLITDRDNHRVLEVTATGGIVWQFGQTGVPGGGPTRLNGPHNADRLDNGNTIIADSNNRRIVEVSPAGGIVWTHAVGLNWPRDADRLADGNTLINDSNNRRIIEVTPSGTAVWTYTVSDLSYDADRLDNGNTLISAGGTLLEVNTAGAVVWSYPASTPAEEVWVTNPASGVELYCHIHRPTGFDPARTYPGLVMIPGGSGTGTSFDQNGRAQSYANLEFVAMHFDADGRGQSTDGGTYTSEDYCGVLQQDGLRAVLQYLASLPEVDADNVGVLTNSYGITLGAGTLGRYAGAPRVKFLLDWEGPADRTDTAQPVGHVPHDPADDAWWYEREPTNFIDDFPGDYLRVQSEIDHVQSDNEHAIKLNNAATNALYGGSGRCRWTRVNSATGVTSNAPNGVYSLASPPQWIPESTLAEGLIRDYLVELANRPPLLPGDWDGDGELNAGDWTEFVPCLGGPQGGSIAGGCGVFDIEPDGDVDLADFAGLTSTVASR